MNSICFNDAFDSSVCHDENQYRYRWHPRDRHLYTISRHNAPLPILLDMAEFFTWKIKFELNDDGCLGMSPLSCLGHIKKMAVSASLASNVTSYN
jgi:hypothetical protein